MRGRVRGCGCAAWRLVASGRMWVGLGEAWGVAWSAWPGRALWLVGEVAGPRVRLRGLAFGCTRWVGLGKACGSGPIRVGGPGALLVRWQVRGCGCAAWRSVAPGRG